MDEARRRPFSRRGNRAGHRSNIFPGLDSLEEEWDRGLSFALQDAVYGAGPVLYDGAGREGGAVSADADERLGEARLCRLGEIGDLRDVCKVVAGKRDDIRPPALQQLDIGP